MKIKWQNVYMSLKYNDHYLFLAMQLVQRRMLGFVKPWGYFVRYHFYYQEYYRAIKLTQVISALAMQS